MPAPKGNQNAKGNKGGGAPTKFKPEYVEQARKLCAMGFTDAQLARFFGVTEKTIITWRKKHVEFATAVKVGKAKTDDEVERAVVKGIAGYYVEVEETIAKGIVRKLKRWIPGNPGVGMRWLALRRPEVYRENLRRSTR